MLINLLGLLAGREHILAGWGRLLAGWGRLLARGRAAGGLEIPRHNGVVDGPPRDALEGQSDVMFTVFHKGSTYKGLAFCKTKIPGPRSLLAAASRDTWSRKFTIPGWQFNGH